MLEFASGIRHRIVPMSRTARAIDPNGRPNPDAERTDYGQNRREETAGGTKVLLYGPFCAPCAHACSCMRPYAAESAGTAVDGAHFVRERRRPAKRERQTAQTIGTYAQNAHSEIGPKT